MIINEQQRLIVLCAVDSGIEQYLSTRREMVGDFVENNYSFKGSFNLNKKAFGLDMLKTPANILWTAPYFLLSGTGLLLNKLSKQRFGKRLTQLPAGFKTAVEREVSWRIYSQLLELPYQDQEKKHEGNALFDAILQQPQLSDLFDESFQIIANLINDQHGQDKLNEHLSAYVDSRKAASELSCVLISVAVGYLANRGVNLGALSLGSTVATSFAHYSAVSSFALGNSMGALYYSLLPTAASKMAIVFSTGGVAIILGMIASYTGMFTDPLQKSLGWHDKKLHKLIDGLEQNLSGQSEQSHHYKDGYVARILDLADILLTVSSKLK